MVTTPSDVRAPGPELSHRGVLKVFSGLMLAMFLGALDQTIVSTAGPKIVGELGDLSTLPWIFSVYMLTSTASVPLYGKLSDLYGRRPLLQIAIAVFIVGSIAVGLSQDMPQMIAARGLQGLGAGGLVPLSLAVIGDILPPRARGKYQGYITSVFALASVAGPLAGGFFVDNLSWRWAFYINVPLSFLAVVVIRRNLPVTARRNEVDIDYAGAALLTFALTSILIVTLFVESGGLVSAWTIGFTLLGLGSLVWLRSVERRAAEPMVPPELFSDAVFNVTNALGFLMGLSLFGALVFLPLFLQVSQGLSATESGLSLVPLMACLTVASLVGGRLLTRIGRYKIFAVVGTGLVMVGMGGLTTIEVASSPAVIGVLVGLLGAGIGLGMPVLTTAVQNSVPVRHLGAATSLSQFSRTVGGILGISVFGAVLTARVLARLDRDQLGGSDVAELIADPDKVARLTEPTRAIVRAALAHGVVVVIAIAAVMAVGAFVTSFFLRDAELRDQLVASAEDSRGA